MKHYRLGLGSYFYDADTGAGTGGAAAATAAAAAGGTGSGAGGTGAGTGGATAAPTDWIAGIKDEALRGYVQTKGFKDPETVVNSYFNLEKLMGVPKEQIIKRPTDMATEGEQYYRQLGKPEKPEGYDIKPAENGTVQDKNFAEWAKSAFHKSNLSTDQAKALVGELTAYQTDQAKAQTAAAEAQAQVEFESLKTQWGNAYDQKLAVTKAGAKEFGLTEAQIDGIQKNLGYEKTMKLFHDIGAKLGEGNFVAGAQRTGNGPMDVDTAKANLTAKKADTAFMAKYMGGDAAAKAEMARLFADAYPGQITIG